MADMDEKKTVDSSVGIPTLGHEAQELEPALTTSTTAEEKGDAVPVAPSRAVAFPDDDTHQHHITVATPNAGNKEMRRELTKDEKELASAGYAELKGKKADKVEATQVDIIEQRLTPSEVAVKFTTSINVEKPTESVGLTAAEAAKRLVENGPNQLTPPKKVPGWRKYLNSLASLFNILLILAGILEYILLGVDFNGNFPNLWIGGILIAVAFLNAGIEHYQVSKADSILASFLLLIPASCQVVRDSQIISIPANNLVAGDVVLIRMGDKTPADLYVYAATALKVDNSSLTGESEPQERGVALEGDKARAAEATNLVFNSTLVVAGEAYGIVVRTGDHTFIGQIASLTAGENNNKSPLSVEIDHFVKIISSIAISTAILFFVIGIASVYKGRAAATVTFAVSILVAWVPEGLPATVSLLLSIAAKRMAAENVLVKSLEGVETLGSVSMICTDKTGTLTRNQMTASNCWCGSTMYTEFQANNDEDIAVTLDKDAPNMGKVIDICALNSRIKFNRTDIPFGERELLGDATETGLTRFAAKHLENYDVTRDTHPVAFSIPFNSDTKTALVIVKKENAGTEKTSASSLAVLVKGAPERVLDRCSAYLDSTGAVQPMSDEFKASYDKAYHYMASRGHRVIGLAKLLLPATEYPHDFVFTKDNTPAQDYVFVGLISLEDPPKHAVRESIGKLRQAGIVVCMVTGDHPLTAEAIAKKINLITGETKQDVATRTGRPLAEIEEEEYDAIVVNGAIIDSLQGWEWDQIFSKSEIVFARVSPKHKLEIVKHAQALGHVVGVTGDGVNDAPALKAADLGIAMNISGSDVSKEAANMILLDDEFSSIVIGVAEGRLVFANLKRSIMYTVSHSMPEVIPQILYILVPIPLPISALLILVIDLGFELFMALSFAYDPPESSEALMRAAPRKPVTKQSIQLLKQRALRRIKTRAIDPETSEFVEPSRMGKAWTSFTSIFTRQYWEDVKESIFSKSEGEVLVDFNLLSYSYLEVGIIETIGALVGYFVVFYVYGFSPYDLKDAQSAQNAAVPITYFLTSSPDYINARGQIISGVEQADAWARAISIVYFSIYVQQCFNVFAVKARYHIPFGKQVVSNKWSFIGIVSGGILTILIVYIPALRVAFGSTYLLVPYYWFIPMGFGCLILAWTSARVYWTRGKLSKSAAPTITGLRMFKTQRTMSIREKN